MTTLSGALAPLAQYRQFILVQFTPRPGAPGKSDKFPCDYRTGRMTPKNSGGAHNPEFWTDHATAAAVADTLGPAYGVGFVITATDDIICLDLDDCAQPDGTWKPEALAMLATFPGAVERSNSGTGLHVWARYSGACPPHGKKALGWLELYSEKRFMALGSAATGVMGDVAAILPAFIEQWFPASTVGEDGDDWRTEPVPEYTVLDDDTMLARALAQTRQQVAASVFGDGPPLPSFADLWNRNVPVLALAFPPGSEGKDLGESEADFALAKELAYWTGKNHERIRALMRRSAMVRDKWDTRRGAKTYLDETIINAVNLCQAVYHTAPVEALVLPAVEDDAARLAPVALNYEPYMSCQDMAAIFANCAYIQDSNSILMPSGDIVDQPRFRAAYAGRNYPMNIENTKTTPNAWEAYLENQAIRFPRVQGTAFRPDLKFQDVVRNGGRQWVNVYIEAQVTRTVGDVTPFLSLLKKILPRGDDAIILLSYMAAVVQYKGVKFKWAPFVQGTQGNGKSTLTECLMRALGDKYIFTVKSAMLENHFNAWLENHILYVADDVYTVENRGNMMEELKTLITDVRQAVTYKGIDSVQKGICGNFIFNSNHKDALKKTDDARRICTLYCAQQSKADLRRDGLTEAYFNGLYDWLHVGGGFAMVSEYLATVQIDPRYNPAGRCKTAPDTSATIEAVIDGRTGVEHEVAEWVELGEVGFCGDFISHHILRERLQSMPRHSRSVSPLKLKEMLARLGYEVHPGLPGGRCISTVQPDDARPILYVKRDSWQSGLTDPAQIAALYTQAQQAAISAAVQKRFQQSGV